MTDSSIQKDFTKPRIPDSTARMLVVTCLLTGVLGSYWLWNHIEQRNIITTVREWARLDPLPPGVEDLKIITTGSMFTRGLRVNFYAPMHEIESWLASSPGTAGMTPEFRGDIRVYKIQPGGGAMFAELSVDPSDGHVHIHTYWS